MVKVFCHLAVLKFLNLGMDQNASPYENSTVFKRNQTVLCGNWNVSQPMCLNNEIPGLFTSLVIGITYESQVAHSEQISLYEN